ncbi:hypothetical protein [Chitinimonas sp.]|uniref:hypothetical protein n=1 Tax=Chitinimonas sp. TaxID=1934313 RepID=UPI0035ADA1A0
MQNNQMSNLFESTLLLSVAALFAFALFSDLRGSHIADQSMVAQQATAVLANTAVRQG